MGSAEHAPRGRNRRWIAAVAAALAATGALSGALVLGGHASKPAVDKASKVKVSTTTVIRTDLSDGQTRSGTLGFGVQTPVKGTADGIVTKLPAVGTTVARGHELYRADDQPVVVFYGDTPMFRTLRVPAHATPTAPATATASATSTASGTTAVPTGGGVAQQRSADGPRGRDVTVVADNLRALGYEIGTVPSSSAGSVYTPALAAAVKRWQEHVGMKPTGILGVGQIVVLPGRIRVNAVQARLGDPVAEPLMSVTSTGKVITVAVDATDVGGITSGARVTVELPDAKEIPGTVTAISQTVQESTGQTGDADPPTLNVTVTPARLADVAKLDSAPVQVRFATATRHGVLAVPVTALVALREGGYAVQRPNGTLLAVKTGLFAGGMVEVSGTGVTAGLRVETAS
jgi:peptidoglycan hydrolase-like protein with peptidoglycan-binding domain